MKLTRKVLVSAVAAILGLGILGTAALAFAPAPAGDPLSVMPDLGTSATAEAPKADRLKALLDGLVSKGVITQQQEDAILAAVKDAAGDRDRDALAKHLFANLFDSSATYLGMQPGDLKAKLPGTSLAAIANATAGKSRDGLVAYLTSAANDAIAKALADGKITPAQADKAKAAAPDHIAKLVDHSWPQAKPRPGIGPNVKAFIGDAINAARTYLGMSVEDVRMQLRAGKSLGEIADAAGNGKSRAGLIAAITNAANANIDKAQQAGKLTADQATQLKTKVQTAVTELVDRKGTTGKTR